LGKNTNKKARRDQGILANNRKTATAKERRNGYTKNLDIFVQKVEIGDGRGFTGRQGKNTGPGTTGGFKGESNRQARRGLQIGEREERENVR